MHRTLFLLYILLVVYTSSLHRLDLLLPLFLILLSVFFTLKRESLKRSLRKLMAVAFFSLVISLPYSLWLWSFDYGIMILLRVLNLYMLTSIFISTVNLYSLLSFSKTLSSLLVLSVSFAITYGRVFENFQQALKSRSMEKPKRSELLNFSKRLMGYFFDRSVRDAEEVSMAMKSRGFDLD